MFNLFGLTFHLYGLIVGFAIAVGIQLIEFRFKKIINPPFSLSQLWQTIGLVSIFAIAGARAWHVLTDWHLYQHNFFAALYIWRGGMSILGAVVGGGFGAYLATRILNFSQPKKSFLTLLDLAVFGVPFAQAIGRLGNYVNQELYGLPTNVPWAIFIEPSHRVSGYEMFDYFHPLFAYEALLMVGFGTAVWWLFYFKKKSLELGSGRLWFVYVGYYCLVRFCLEFLRIDKTMFLQTALGLNQLILLVVGIIAVIFLAKKYEW